MKAILAVLALAAAAAALNPLAELRKQSAERRASNTWAVLVAGSNTYSNYRHQSDICAMYQELHAMGIPDEHIIVLMYDDIAKSSQNPRKGVIINTPGGPDVYKGVPKDYVGNTVTAANFVKILQGQAVSGGSGKQLKSGADDNVFVFFSDHGGLDILAFPVGQYLTSKMLYDAINTMSTKKLFGTLYVTIEACEAGSMFYKYQYPKGVYITTASPVSASSYAWQWDDTVQAYVSDVWSWYMLHYMMDGHESNTLQDQFDYVKESMSNYSMPCQYGHVDLAESNTIGGFFGTANTMGSAVPRSTPVRAWDVAFELAKKRAEREQTAEAREALAAEHVFRTRINKVHAALNHEFRNALLVAQPAECDQQVTVIDCAARLAAVARETCGTHDYVDSLSPLLVGVCRIGNEESAKAVIQQRCSA